MRLCGGSPRVPADFFFFFFFSLFLPSNSSGPLPARGLASGQCLGRGGSEPPPGRPPAPARGGMGAWRPWLALAGALAGAGGVVAAVHWQQKEERRALRQGVLRDMARLKQREETAE